MHSRCRLKIRVNKEREREKGPDNWLEHVNQSLVVGEKKRNTSFQSNIRTPGVRRGEDWNGMEGDGALDQDERKGQMRGQMTGSRE